MIATEKTFLQYFTFLCLLLLTGLLSGQQQPYVATIEYFSTNDGLSHQDVETVMIDERGVVWVGTRNGLNRFNGKDFKIFTVDDGLIDNDIHQIYALGEVLWCIHRNQATNDFIGFSLFHIIEEAVISFESYIDKPFLFDLKDIEEIKYSETTGNILFYTKIKNDLYDIYTFSKEKGFKKAKTLSADLTCFEDPTSTHWIIKKGVENSIQKVDARGDEIFTKKIPALKDAMTIYGIANSNPEELFLYYESHICYEPIIKVDNKGNLTLIEQINKHIEEHFSEDAIDCFSLHPIRYIPSLDVFAFAYLNSFFVFNSSGDLIFKTFFAKEKFGFTQIVGIDEKSNTFWLNTSNGLYQISLSENHFTNYLNDEGLQGFRAILSVDDAVFFNSYSGLYQYSKTNKTIAKIQFGGVGCIYSQAYGLWINVGGDFYNLDLESKKSRLYSVPNSIETWALFFDEERLWFSWRGINYFDVNTQKTGAINYNEFEELKTATVYHFYQKSKNKVLLSATTGLYEWDLNKGILARYWKEGKGKYHIPAKDFRHLCYDNSDTTFWLATAENGLIHWSPTTNQSQVYHLHRRQSNTIHAVYPDDYGYLWLSTENGIFQFNKATQNIRAYYPKDGTSSHEFNRTSHFQDKDGTIYFGSINGITSFHPKDFYEVDKEINKTKIIVLEISQHSGRTEKIENVTKHYYQKNEVQMRPGDRFLNFSLTLDDYSQSAKTIYNYRLKGVDENWLEAKGSEITLSGLPYGNQVLEIRGSLLNGSYAPVLEIPIQVYPPFYLTWWFFVSMIIAIGLGTYLIIRWRTEDLNRQKKTLQQEVIKRTEKISQQTEKLKALDKTKSRFFANVSHELRTPITLIQGPIQSVLNNQTLTETSHRLLTKAQQNAKSLLGLVNEILDLTRLESNKLELVEKPTIFYAFLKRITANFQSLAKSKSINFSLKYLPQKELQINLDREKFEKILNNLLSNAFKFTPKGGSIDIIVESQNQDLLLQVKDNGRGIPEVDLPHVFDRHYQSSINKKAEGGLGIGLALSMEIVQLMGGKMWAESPGVGLKKGSTFFVKFPKNEIHSVIIDEEEIAEKEIHSIKTENKAPHLDTTTSNQNTEAERTILLVEDNLDLQDYIQFLLEPQYKIVKASNGQEAWEYLSSRFAPPAPKGERPPVVSASEGSSSFRGLGGVNEALEAGYPHLILSDVMMPVMDGFELLEKVKSTDHFRHIPFIMLTARAEWKDKLKALRVGVDDYLIKPFQEEELKARIENLIANYELRQEFIQAQDVSTSAGKSQKTTEVFITSEKEKKWLEELEHTINENLNHPLFGNDYLAELLHISRKKLYQKIKTLTGLTPNQYIRAIRLQLAKELLENEACQTVKEVALKVGFQKHGHFTELFKKRYGKLPSEYF